MTTIRTDAGVPGAGGRPPWLDVIHEANRITEQAGEPPLFAAPDSAGPWWAGGYVEEYPDARVILPDPDHGRGNDEGALLGQQDRPRRPNPAGGDTRTRDTRPALEGRSRTALPVHIGRTYRRRTAMTNNAPLRPAQYLTYHRRAIETALGNDAVSAQEDAQTMRKVADTLRAGARVPLFAPGEDGARAADGIAERHHRRHVEAEAALTALKEVEW